MTRLALPAMPVDDWPALDRQLWLASRQPAGLFDEAGLASTWRPATVRTCEQGYGVYLRWLASIAQLDWNGHPCARVSPERIRSFVEEYRPGRSELTVAGAVRGVAYVLRACVPPDGVPWLTELAHRLTNTARPARPKLPRMARVSDVLALSHNLMADGLTNIRAGGSQGAPFYRDGLMIALLIQRPLRLRNLGALRIDHSLVFDDGCARIRFSREETKKGRPIDVTVPQSLISHLEAYLSDVRPIFLRRAAQDEGWLWLTRRGRRMREVDITIRISRLTQQHLGRAISPHLFRDCAATEIALEDPTHIGITKDVLGHATLASSQKYYNQATSFTAFARHQDVIQRLRDGE